MSGAVRIADVQAKISPAHHEWPIQLVLAIDAVMKICYDLILRTFP